MSVVSTIFCLIYSLKTRSSNYKQLGVDCLHLGVYNCSGRVYWQDAMDLIAGHYTVSRDNPSPFELNSFEAIAVSDLLALIFFPFLIIVLVQR